MPEIRAAGFVVFRRAAGRLLYLTMTNAKHGDVGVPKGKAEPGEDDWTTALRETEEETGLAGDALVPNRWFRREVRYPVRKGNKTVVYFAAEARTEEITYSGEHASVAWLDLADTLLAMQHDNIRSVVANAAAFLKDPILRQGLAPQDARALLASKVGEDAPLMRHVAQVAGMARAMAEARGDVDADYVESAAWLHDVGRARTHGVRHPIEGFYLLLEEGWPGYAPCCLSHYTRGAAFDALKADDDLKREMWAACDLSTFEPEERLVALADFMAAGDRRVTLEERRDDLVARYGPAPLFDDNLEICRRLKAEFEARTGTSLYPLLGIG